MSKPKAKKTISAEASEIEVYQPKKEIMRQVLEGATAHDLIRHWSNLTVGHILDRGYPPIAGLRNTYGADKVEKVMTLLIIEASESFAERFTRQQAGVIAATVITEYYWFTLEDLYLVLHRLQRKPMFGKLTPNKVLSELAEYREERLNLAAMRNVEDHHRRFTRRQREAAPRPTIEFQKALAEETEKLKQKESGKDS